MTINQLANQDFERAVWAAFWRKILSRLTGENNELLPFDEIRQGLPIRGQHYLGHHQVPIDQIIGSQGRYNDFDRAFLPIQTRTRQRWVNIDIAHYEQVDLPPVELYKVGEVYFVKDGNHRVSVARQQGQQFVDAYVTEIEVSVPITRDFKVDDLEMKKEYAEFIATTRLNELRPEALITTSFPGLYAKLLEHIAVHRYYLGEKRRAEVPYHEAVESWYDNVYLPLVQILEDQGLAKEFPGLCEGDLYLWVMEYQGYLRQEYAAEDDEQEAKAGAARYLSLAYPLPAVRKLVTTLTRSAWIDQLILEQERATFLEQTRLTDLRLEAQIEVTIPGQYARLQEHIAVHRWYLGEKQNAEVPYPQAVTSWYDNVYLPLVEVIREQNVLEKFPGRSETDLYLWIIRHQWNLREEYGNEVSIEEAIEQYTEDQSQGPVNRVKDAIKKATGKK